MHANKSQNEDKKIIFGNFDITYLKRENDRIEEHIFELFDEVEKGNNQYEEIVFKDKIKEIEGEYEERLIVTR